VDTAASVIPLRERRPHIAVDLLKDPRLCLEDGLAPASSSKAPPGASLPAWERITIKAADINNESYKDCKHVNFCISKT
jgi:hypothetical protein